MSSSTMTLSVTPSPTLSPSPAPTGQTTPSKELNTNEFATYASLFFLFLILVGVVGGRYYWEKRKKHLNAFKNYSLVETTHMQARERRMNQEAKKTFDNPLRVEVSSDPIDSSLLTLPATARGVGQGEEAPTQRRFAVNEFLRSVGNPPPPPPTVPPVTPQTPGRHAANFAPSPKPLSAQKKAHTPNKSFRRLDL